MNIDLTKPNPKTQTILRNIEVHEEVLRILHLHYQPYLSSVFKNCYLFIKQVIFKYLIFTLYSNFHLFFLYHKKKKFVLNNKVNQNLIFPHLDLFLEQMGYKLNITDVIQELLHNNDSLCSKIDLNFISHMVKLIYDKGRKRKYVGLLGVS